MASNGEPTHLVRLLRNEKSSGKLSYFKKAFHTSLHTVDVVHPPLKPPSTNPVPPDTSHKVPANASKIGSSRAEDESKARERRKFEAQKRFQAAATVLQNAMSSASLQVPNVIGLQHLDCVDDLERTSQTLESAIDVIIEERRVTTASRALWKNCIIGWFKAVYPYVKVGLNEASVRGPMNINKLTRL